MQEKVLSALVKIPGYGTALPSTPSDGDEFILVDSTTAPTYQWRFRFIAAKTTNKWVCVGGAPAFAEVLTSNTISSDGTYVDGGTVGPSFTLPVAGQYRIEFGCQMNSSAAANMFAAPYLGTTPSDNDKIHTTAQALNYRFVTSRILHKTIASAALIKIQYKRLNANYDVSERWLSVSPIAVGG